MDFGSLVELLLFVCFINSSLGLVIALAGHPLWRSEKGLKVGGPFAFGFVIVDFIK